MIISTVEKCFHFYLMQEGERGGRERGGREREVGERGGRERERERERWEKHKVILHVLLLDMMVV